MFAVDTAGMIVHTDREMKHVTITNTSRWKTDEIAPLLQVAWASAKPEFKRPAFLCGLRLRINSTRTRAWCCRTHQGHATLSFAAPGRFDNVVTQVGTTPVHGMSEVIVAVAAWVFVAANGGGRFSQSVSRDAVHTYRQHKVEVDAKIAAVIQRKKDKIGESFAQEVFDGFEQSKLSYKLNKLEEKEQVWQRKLKLATTKIKSLRRRKAALQAAETRRQRKLEALPPSTPETQ